MNQIKWEDLDKPEYRAVRDYYKGLIDFRKNHAALRLIQQMLLQQMLNIIG